MRIPPFYISDNSKVDGDNKHMTMNGFSTLGDGFHINYDKRPEGYAFFRPGQEAMFIVAVQDLDTEVSPAVRAQLSKEHLEIFDKIIGLRHKLYAFKAKLDSKNIKFSMYDFNRLRVGYFAQYGNVFQLYLIISNWDLNIDFIEILFFRYDAPGLAGGISHSKNEAGEYNGRFSCGGKDQNYSVVNGTHIIVLNGTPYSPIEN